MASYLNDKTIDRLVDRVEHMENHLIDEIKHLGYTLHVVLKRLEVTEFKDRFHPLRCENRSIRSIVLKGAKRKEVQNDFHFSPPNSEERSRNLRINQDTFQKRSLKEIYNAMLQTTPKVLQWLKT